MSDTPSVSRVFTRSCALNSLLTPAAVQQIRTDLPVVTEICHEASLLLQSFSSKFSVGIKSFSGTGCMVSVYDRHHHWFFSKAFHI
ncbi:hypothetical protein P9112_008597 [Eukaryota sp. TZLM1-RC]